jgi:quercetin dioxygenase-like cupin family protein
MAAIVISGASGAHDADKLPSQTAPFTITPVLQQPMSDPGLAGYQVLAVRLDLVPGGTDPTPHRHDADLFVYVLQGSIEVELAGRKSVYGAGQMFHEPQNVVHSLLRNTSTSSAAAALAVFVLKDGRQYFVPLSAK